MVLKWSRICLAELQRKILSHFLQIVGKALEGNSGVGLSAGAFLTSKTTFPACTFSEVEVHKNGPRCSARCWFCLPEHPLFPGRFLSCREDAQELHLGSPLPLEVISLFVCLGGFLEGFF